MNMKIDTIDIDQDIPRRLTLIMANISYFDLKSISKPVKRPRQWNVESDATWRIYTTMLYSYGMALRSIASPRRYWDKEAARERYCKLVKYFDE